MMIRLSEAEAANNTMLTSPLNFVSSGSTDPAFMNVLTTTFAQNSGNENCFRCWKWILVHDCVCIESDVDIGS